jgi:hypothetical protein
MRDWHNDVADWDTYRIGDYFNWVSDMYGEQALQEEFAYADEYRALMDVYNTNLPKTEPFVGEIKIP